MISEAIEYPLQGANALERLFVGGVFYLLSPVVVPGILLGGYAVAVVVAVADGRSEPPAFDDWAGAVENGLSVFAIAFVYWLPVLVLAGLGLGAFVLASVLSGGSPGLVSIPVVVLTGLVGAAAVAYALVVGYVLPAAIVNFARTGHLGAAWDVETLRTVVTDGEYARAWIVAGLFLLVASTVGWALSVFLVGFVVLFYGQVAATYLYTRGTMAALGVSPEPPTPPSAPDGVPEEGTGSSDVGEAGEVGAEDAVGDEVVDNGSESVANDEGSEYASNDASEGAAGTLTDVAGVGPATAESLREAGYETVADLDASRDELTDVDGIGPAKADQIKRDVDGT